MENEMQIGLNSPLFEEMVESADTAIQEVIEDLYKGGFEKGHILVSFDLSLIPNENDNTLKAPSLSYKVNSSCKRESKQKGNMTSLNAIVERDGEYVEVSVKAAQKSIFEEDGDDE
jgi:hypothetical protein